MADPTSYVDADDPIVADLLAASLELVAEAGGWIDPQARLVARDGQLHIESNGTPDAPLLRIPRAAWVRVDAVAWADEPDRLVVAGVPDDIGDIELEMLYTQVALHNQCRRLPWLAQTHPSLATDIPDDVVLAVRELVPSFRTVPTTPRDVLFSNRCFRMRLDDQAGPERVLVPVVDLLNHHHEGATGSVDAAAITVTARRPMGGAECFLDYGMDRDALEMAVVYGFADASARVAHSGPLSVDVPGVGVVRVRGDGRSTTGSLLPVHAERTTDEIAINRLTFDSDDPDSAMADMMAAIGVDQATAATVVGAIVEANLDRVGALIDACDARSRPSIDILASAARHQRSVLKRAVDTLT